MKRLAKITAALCASALLLTGCSGGTNGKTNSTKPTSLELWMAPLSSDNDDKAMWNKLLEKFEKENGVKVNVTVVPWDAFETQYLTGVASGKGPDVGYMYSEMIGDYITKGQIVDMSNMVTPEQKSNFYFLKNGLFDQKQYMIPFVVGAARVLFYNKDLLKKANVEPPTTWEDFLKAGEKLKAAGIKPYQSAWADKSRGQMNSAFFPFVWQAGGKLFSPDGKKAEFNSPEVLKAAKYLLELKQKGVLSPDTTGVTPNVKDQEFLDKKVAFIVNWSQDIDKYKKAGINYGWITSLKDKEQGTFVSSDSLTMLKKCPDQKLCYKLISYITSGPVMSEFHKKANFPPLGKDEKTNTDDEFSKIYTEQTNVLHTLPVVPKGTGTYQVLYSNLQQMLNGEKTPEQALNDAQKQAQQILDK